MMEQSVQTLAEKGSHMDLNQIVMDSFVKIQSEGFIEATVEKVLRKTLESAIDDTLRSYSDFGRNLEKEVKEKLQINLNKLDIAQYNMMVLNTVKEELDKAIHVQGVAKIKEKLQGILGGANQEYKLSELIEEMKNNAIDHSDHESDGSEISLHVDKRSSLTFINFDENEDVEEYRCKYRIVVNNDDHTVSSVNIRDKEFKNDVIMGGLYGLEATLFKLYSNGAKLIVDEDGVDSYYPGLDD